MSSIALQHTQRDAFAPRRAPGMRSGLVLALIAHALLIAALAWSVRWHASEPEGVEAELWSALPQIAAPRAVAPEAPPQPVVPPPPQALRPPVAEPARPDPQIAIEKAAREREARDVAEREKQKEKQKRDDKRRAEAEADKQRLAEAQQRKQALDDKARQEQARADASRAAYMKRVMGQAGGSETATATGNAARTSGPSAGYAGRIKARIKPNIVLTATISGNPVAEVEVRLAPDGTIVGRKLTHPSGSAAWDETVLRAIDKTEVLPRDTDGRVPPTMTIEFKPAE